MRAVSTKYWKQYRKKIFSPECEIKADCLNMLEDVHKTTTHSEFEEPAPAVFDLSLLQEKYGQTSFKTRRVTHVSCIGNNIS